MAAVPTVGGQPDTRVWRSIEEDIVTEPSESTWAVNLGISRRDLLRRGAVVGGALLWTTPMVQTLARPAFAAEGSPEPDGGGHAISYIAVVVSCAGTGTNYRAKFNTDPNEATTGWEDEPGPPNPNGKCYPPNYGNASGTLKMNGGGEGLVVSIDPSDPSKGSLTVPLSLASIPCDVTEVRATAFGGGDCQHVGPVSGGSTIHFDL